jgi:hypothetical protein
MGMGMTQHGDEDGDGDGAQSPVNAIRFITFSLSLRICIILMSTSRLSHSHSHSRVVSPSVVIVVFERLLHAGESVLGAVRPDLDLVVSSLRHGFIPVSYVLSITVAAPPDPPPPLLFNGSSPHDDFALARRMTFVCEATTIELCNICRDKIKQQLNKQQYTMTPIQTVHISNTTN